MTIDISTLIVWIIIGAIAGWLAGLLIKGHSQGTLANIIVGLLGSLVGGILFTLLRIQVPSFLSGQLTIRLSDIVIAFIGAVVIYVVVGELRKRGVSIPK